MILKLRVTIDITYETNGESATDLIRMAHRIAEHAAGQGMMTENTAAEVDEWTDRVEVLP